MSEYIIFVQRIALSGAAQTVSGLKGLIILPILTQELGAEGYGGYVFILGAVALLQPFIQLGLGNSTARFLSSKTKQEIVQGVGAVLLVLLATGAIGALLLLLSSDFLASVFLDDLDQKTAINAIRVASALLILEALHAVALGSFRIFGHIKRFSLVLLLSTALEIGLIASFVLLGYGLAGAVMALLTARIIILVVEITLMVSYAGFARPDFSILRPFFAFGIPLTAMVLSEIVLMVGDRFVIGYYLGSSGIGIYLAAYAIGWIPAMFVEFITYILGPTVFDLFDNGKINEVRTYISYSWKYLLMISIPAAFGLSILGEPLLENLTSTEFVSDGRIVIPLVTLAAVIYGIYPIFGMMIRLSKKTRIFAVAAALAAVLNLGLNFLFVPHWGIVGAAIATAISYAFVALLIGYRSRTFMKFDINTTFIVKSVISSVVMVLVIWVLNPVGKAEVALSIVVGVTTYAAGLYLLKGINNNEIRFVFEILTNSAKEIKSSYQHLVKRIR